MLRRSWLYGGVASLVWALSSASISTTTSTAHAQPAKATANPAPEVDPNDPWEVGKAAFDAGRLEEALNAFETSYKQTKKPRTLFRVGDTADKLGNHARAVSAFQELLSLAPSSKDRPFIEGRIRANEAAAAQGAGGVATAQPTAAASRGDASANTAPSEVARAASARVAPTAAPTAVINAGDAGDTESAAGPIWLWAGAGVVAVAAIVVAGLLIGSSSASSTPAPVRGNVGGTIQTLGAGAP